MDVLYIGENYDYISRISQSVNNDVLVLSEMQDLDRYMLSHQGYCDIILFYEKDSIQFGLDKIISLRNNLKNIYIILIAQQLTNGESLSYLRSGINNIIDPLANEIDIHNLVHLIQRNRVLLSGQAKACDKPNDLKITSLHWSKRLLDIAFSLIAIILLLPIFIFVIIAIRLESPGAVLYKSKRAGRNYQIFDFYKFRSMYQDADKRLKDYLVHNQYATSVSSAVSSDGYNEIPVISQLGHTSEPIYVYDNCIITETEYIRKKHLKEDQAFIKLEHDPRVTKVGRFIRKYSIDELPQLINILKGDMSIVGNRPLPLYEAELLTIDESVERFAAPAGLTGLWQVEKRGNAGRMSAQERKDLDVYYALNHNIWLDFKIIFKSFRASIQEEDV